MKTPRDILIAKHQAAEPKLAALRRDVLEAELGEGRCAAAPKFRVADTATLPKLFWRELVWPCRRIWAGLAALWLLIIIVNVAQRDGSKIVNTKSPASAGVMMTFRDQQRLLDELFADRSLQVEANQPRNYLPKPRTATVEWLTV